MLLLPSPGASHSAACGSNNVGQASGGLLYEAGSLLPSPPQHTHFWACGVRSGWSVDGRQLQRKLSGEAAGEALWRGSKAEL